MVNRASRRKAAKASEITVVDLRERILRALDNKDYIARTVSGIAKEVHVAPRQVGSQEGRVPKRKS